MNNSVVTKGPDFDYRFLVYLLNEVFEKTILGKSSVYQTKNRNHKYSELDKEKLAFVEGTYLNLVYIQQHLKLIFYLILILIYSILFIEIFLERVGNGKRFQYLGKHINKRYQTLRNQSKKKSDNNVSA